MCAVWLGELNAVPVTPLGEDNWQLKPGFSRTPPYAPVSLDDFHLYPFTVINHNCESNIFSEFCESFKQTVEPEGNIGGSTQISQWQNL